MSEPKFTRRKITEYLPDAQNANLSSERGHRIIDDSVSQDGAGRSGLADKNGVIIAGNQTLNAMIENGIEDVIEIETSGNEWVIVKRVDADVNDPDPNNLARRMAYRDNRSQELSLNWNPARLLSDMQTGVDLSKLWSAEELAELLAGQGDEDATPDAGAQVDRAAELQAIWQVSRGDVWRIGKHRIMCGDSTSAADVATLMDGAKMQGAFTSPPYAEQRKEQYGGTPTDEYVQWWEAIQANVRAHLRDDGSFFVNIKPHCEDGERVLYVMDLVIAMRRQWGWRYVDEYCWLRTGIPQQVVNRFKNQFEPVYWFALSENFKFYPERVMHETDREVVAIGAGAGNTNAARRQGKGRGAVPDNEIRHGMAYPGNVLNLKMNAEVLGHPAVFPVALPDFFIRAYSDNGDTWYDPFLGSGTTLVACEQTGRIGYGMEISPEYCSVVLQRLADMNLKPERVS